MPKKTVKKAIVKTVEKKTGISAAIREALQELGVDAPAKDVGNYIAAKYPEHTEATKKDIWGTYVSQQRKGLRKGQEVGKGKATTGSMSISIDEALQILEEAKANGFDIAALKKMVEHIGSQAAILIIKAIGYVSDEQKAHEERQKKFTGLFGK